VIAGQLADFRAVGGDQRRLVAAGLGEGGRAEDPGGDRLGQGRTRNPHTKADQGRQQEGDEQQQADPLDRRLPLLRFPHMAGKGSGTALLPYSSWI